MARKTGQTGPVRLDIARALEGIEKRLRPLQAEGFLTRDARVKEPRKYDRKKARGGFQFVQR